MAASSSLLAPSRSTVSFRAAPLPGPAPAANTTASAPAIAGPISSTVRSSRSQTTADAPSRARSVAAGLPQSPRAGVQQRSAAYAESLRPLPHRGPAGQVRRSVARDRNVAIAIARRSSAAEAKRSSWSSTSRDCSCRKESSRCTAGRPLRSSGGSSQVDQRRGSTTRSCVGTRLGHRDRSVALPLAVPRRSAVSLPARSAASRCRTRASLGVGQQRRTSPSSTTFASGRRSSCESSRAVAGLPLRRTVEALEHGFRRLLALLLQRRRSSRTSRPGATKDARCRSVAGDWLGRQDGRGVDRTASCHEAELSDRFSGLPRRLAMRKSTWRRRRVSSRRPGSPPAKHGARVWAAARAPTPVLVGIRYLNASVPEPLPNRTPGPLLALRSHASSASPSPRRG